MYSLLHKYKGITIGVISIASGAFFLWLFFYGGVRDITSPSKKCVAEVNSGCITLKDYRRELLRYSNLIQNQGMEKLIREQIIENLVAQELLYQKAKELSFIASDEEVVEVIKSDPSFQEGGIFTTSKYREVLSKIGLSPEEYEEYIRRMLSIQKLINFISNGVYISDRELEANYSAESTMLSGSLFLITSSDISQKYTPSEEELLSYYQKNKEFFKRPEGKLIKVWKVKEKDRASNLYNMLKTGKEPEGGQEVRLPEESSLLSQSLIKEVERLSQRERVSITKEGEEYVVLYLKEVLPAGYEEFQKVKDKVKERLLEEKAQSLLLERAKEVAKELKEGKRPTVKVLNFTDTPLSQLSAVLNVDRKDTSKILFSQERVFGPYPLKQGYGVLVIEKRTQRELKEEEKKEVMRDLISLKSETLLTRYVEGLKKGAKIRVNKELLGGG